MSPQKLYLVTRRDLPVGTQVAQLCHAFRQFVAEHAAAELRWLETSNTVACLEVEDEASLLRIADRLTTYSLFREPDLGGAATAFATLEGQALRRLRLVGT